MNPVADTYNDMRGLIQQIAYKNWLMQGGELDEYISICNLAFMKAYTHYDYERGYFTTMLVWCCRNDLITEGEKGNTQKRIQQSIMQAPIFDDLPYFPLDIQDELNQLGNSTMEIIRLIDEFNINFYPSKKDFARMHRILKRKAKLDTPKAEVFGCLQKLINLWEHLVK